MARTEPRTAPTEMKRPVTLADVDLFCPGAQEHWYEAYPILHEQAPVLRLPGEGAEPGTDGFILSKYQDILRVVRDSERFPPGLTTPPKLNPDGSMPQMNAMIASIQSLRPNEDLWRAHKAELTDPWVGTGATRHRDMIAAAATALIDGWIDKGAVDFVGAFARPLPQMVMANVLGFPYADIPRMEMWGAAQVMAFVHGKGHRNQLTPEQMGEQMRLLAGFGEYVATSVIEKRRAPKDDMISWLTQVTYGALDRKLTDTEINGIVYAMMIGGLETTQYAMAEQAQLFCEDPDLYRSLRDDRSKLRNFIEESLRLRSPTQGLSTRTTTQDEVFQGVRVPAGSLLHMRWAAGNRDPEEWDCPHDLQLDRKGLTRHLTFSQGSRSCPGSGISRLEQLTAWNLLMDRIEAIEYAPGNSFAHQPGIMLGLFELKLNFTAAT
ncbi:cytochrome P450 [Phenylobacterium sp.]|uniref:cytochrome P450 n=1 Tax=Phenylobacterium sp. TaxID=1871053 RepID=UPI0025FF640A|nr:cytochrome P450 [Phenylobacterium sp.]